MRRLGVLSSQYTEYRRADTMPINYKHPYDTDDLQTAKH